MILRVIVTLIFSFIPICSVCENNLQKSPRIIKTIYGSIKVHDKTILELLDSDAVQRLKKIDQYGLIESKSFSRYDHSVGVWFLLEKFGASREEQIAGLLHDASHTVFSHVGDKVFRYAEKKDSYQDKIHEWWLMQTSVPEILKKHGISLSSMDYKDGKLSLLERELPEICVDRLEYNLRGGLIEGLITQREIDKILENIKFENGIFFFTNIDIAKKFAEIPLYLTEYVWGSHKDFVAQIFLAHALRRGVKLNLISTEEILFSTDELVLDKLVSSLDKLIYRDLKFHANCKDLYDLDSGHNAHKSFVCKFRGIDPWIKMPNGELLRLSEINKNFMQYYNLVKDKMSRGFKIKIKNQEILNDAYYLEDLFAV